MPGVRDVRTLGWPLMVVVGVLGCGHGCLRTGVARGWPLIVVVGVQDAGKDAGGPAWRVAAADGGGWCSGCGQGCPRTGVARGCR